MRWGGGFHAPTACDINKRRIFAFYTFMMRKSIKFKSILKNEIKFPIQQLYICITCISYSLVLRTDFKDSFYSKLWFVRTLSEYSAHQ